jgi:coenzyme PQQ precursor peptide PqqA
MGGPSSALANSVREKSMSWTAPVIVEVCIGMEITSYVSAEI